MMSREFGLGWKDADAVRMDGFIVILQEMNKSVGTGGIRKDGRASFR